MPSKLISIKRRGKLFVKGASFISEDEKGNAVYEQRIDTYKVIKQDNKFIVFQLNRKRKPRRVKTLKRTSKRKTIADAIDDIRYENVNIRNKQTKRIGKFTTVSQTDYKARIKKFPQMVALVHVVDIKRGISDILTGFSKKIPTSKLSYDDISDMQEDCIKMAIGKFIERHGKAEKTDYIDATIIEVRFQYYRKTG